MIVLDANILVSAVLGRHVEAQIGRLVAAGVELAVPIPQLDEASRVLTEKLGLDPTEIGQALARVCAPISELSAAEYATSEEGARARLHGRGQSDWPVLASALALDAEIWSNDRDFFGVGVSVWSTRNVSLAVGGATKGAGASPP